MYNRDQDLITKAEYAHSRRPRLTLFKLNQMRRAKDMKRVEQAQRNEFLPTMYKSDW